MFREPRIRKERLFQTRPPKGFEYEPRYYDPEKERIQELKRRAGELVDESSLHAGNTIREGSMRRRRTQKGAQWSYLLRLLIILLGLLAFLGWFDINLLG